MITEALELKKEVPHSDAAAVEAMCGGHTDFALDWYCQPIEKPPNNYSPKPETFRCRECWKAFARKGRETICSDECRKVRNRRAAKRTANKNYQHKKPRRRPPAPLDAPQSPQVAQSGSWAGQMRGRVF